jgi:hypothetical protein
MDSDLVRKTNQTEKKLSDVQRRIDRLLDSDQIDAALKLRDEYQAAKHRSNRLRAQIKAESGGDLWEATAQALTGNVVIVKWDRTKTGGIGEAADQMPPVITIDPYITSKETELDTFLHEIGHIVDYSKNDSRKNTSEERELQARAKARAWRDWADKHCMQYDRIGRSGLEIRLRALIFGYPIID